jgi:hypothetical protein
LSPSIEAFSTGCRRRQSVTALAMNEVNVSFAPWRSYSSFFVRRIWSTRE